MKAAVIYQRGDMPQCADLPEPVIQNDDELLISVKAAAIKHFDKGRAGGKHYSANTNKENATVIGGDGVGLLADGTRVFALGVSGMVQLTIYAQQFFWIFCGFVFAISKPFKINR